MERAGRLLYGQRWRRPLAHDLGVVDRTIRVWARQGMPAAMHPRLLALLEARGAAVRALAGQLERAGEDAGR